MKKEYLVKIDELRKDEACNAYFKWKELNIYLKSLVTRGINMHDAISEPLGCYCLDLLWNKQSGGDAFTKDGKSVEFKASSNFDRDLTSFGPKTVFDKLVFLRFDVNLDILYVYDLKINSEQLKALPVSKTATIGDYQNVGKRPRTNVINKVIIPQNIKPTKVFDIRKGKIVETV